MNLLGGNNLFAGNIGYKINVDGTIEYFRYGNISTINSLEEFITTRGDIFIQLEIKEYNNGFYKLYGFTTGYCSFNRYGFETCNPKGDVLVLAFNLYGENRDVNWQHFNSIYCQEEEEEEEYLADELQLTDYPDDGFRVSDNEDNIYNQDIVFDEDWQRNIYQDDEY